MYEREIMKNGIMVFAGSRSSRSIAEYIGVAIFCGICFLVLKLLFPGRSSTWYINRIKIIATVGVLLMVIITLIARH